MSKKDYILIASVIRGVVDQGYRRSITDGYDLVQMLTLLAEELADELKVVNPRFDRDRFLDACGAR